MHGADFLACSNMSRTRLAPTPTNISTKSEPEMVKNGTPASPAIARASSVLPVPGEPTSSAPFGILPPSRANLVGSFRNSTISCNSSRASSMPATSSNVTLPCFSVSILARDLPKPIAPDPLDFCIWRSTKNAIPSISRKGSELTSIICQNGAPSSGLPLTSTPPAISRSVSCGSGTALVRNVDPSASMPVIVLLEMSARLTDPSFTLAMNAE